MKLCNTKTAYNQRYFQNNPQIFLNKNTFISSNKIKNNVRQVTNHLSIPNLRLRSLSQEDIYEHTNYSTKMDNNSNRISSRQLKQNSFTKNYKTKSKDNISCNSFRGKKFYNSKKYNDVFITNYNYLNNTNELNVEKTLEDEIKEINCELSQKNCISKNANNHRSCQNLNHNCNIYKNFTNSTNKTNINTNIKKLYNDLETMKKENINLKYEIILYQQDQIKSNNKLKKIIYNYNNAYKENQTLKKQLTLATNSNITTNNSIDKRANSFEKRNKILIKNINELTAINKQLNYQIQNLNTKLKNIVNENESLKEKNFNLNNKILNNKNNDTSTVPSDDDKKVIEQLKKENEKLNNKIKNIENQKKEIQVDKNIEFSLILENKSFMEISALQYEKEKLIAENTSLVAKINKMKNDFVINEKEIIEKSNEKCNDYKNRIETEEELVKILKVEVKNLKEKLNKYEKYDKIINNYDECVKNINIILNSYKAKKKIQLEAVQNVKNFFDK